MADGYFDVTQDGAVAHIVLNRPERLNAVSTGFFRALRDALLDLDATGETRAAVISATGPHFCAGMSFDSFGGSTGLFDTSSARTRFRIQELLRRSMACFETIERVRFPVIVAVQGGCIGAGISLATACDIRVCSAEAFFTVQETTVGMTADMGVLQRLQNLIPAGFARQMAYTGERVPAARALTLGLVNEVLADADALRAHALELARTIAARSPLAVAGSKAALNHARDHGISASLDFMAVLQSAIFDGGEMREALAAWKGKRDGCFEPLAPFPSV